MIKLTFLVKGSWGHDETYVSQWAKNMLHWPKEELLANFQAYHGFPADDVYVEEVKSC